MAEITSIKMIAHKDPNDLLMRNVDLTVGIDGEEVDYKKKIPVEDVLLEIILVLEKIENARLTFNREVKDAKRDARDEESRKAKTPPSPETTSEGSTKSRKGSVGKEAGVD